MAKIPLPHRVQSTNREINDVQDAVAETLRRIVHNDQLSGQRVATVSVTSTGTEISHGLGRTPIGWYVTDILDHGTVRRTAWDSRTITLESNSGTIRCDVFVW